MQDSRIGSAAKLAVPLVAVSCILAACGADDREKSTAAPQTAASSDSGVARAPVSGSAASGRGSETGTGPSNPAASAVSAEDYDSTRFQRSTEVDNEWFPLKPGAQLSYEGESIEDEESGEHVPHRVVSTVTDLTKVIDGVRTVVIWERDFIQGQLVEAELAFFAQDDDGTVWRLGEYPEEYEDGELDKAPTWLAGQQGAKAGIAMMATPVVGTPDYAQGLAPKVDWFDRGKVLKVGEQTCVPVDCYDNVLVIDEFTLAEPGAHQLKYYAPGVGNVRVGWSGDDPSQETLELVEAANLSAEDLGRVREEALKLEKNAYRISKGVYGRTPPLEQRG